MNKTIFFLAIIALAAVAASIAFVGEPQQEAAAGKLFFEAPAAIPPQSPNFRGPGDE